LKFAVMGAGALGCVMGGKLAEAGHSVGLISRNTAHMSAIKRRGLIVRENGLDRTISLLATTEANEVGMVDCVLILVKSAQTIDAIHQLAPLLGEHTWVLSLQNGLGHERLLVEHLGAERVLAGKTYCGGSLIAEGHFNMGVVGKRTLIGELDGSISPRITQLAQTFNQAGLLTEVSQNIMGTIWDKLFINVATGAVSGISGLTYGELYQVPELKITALAAVREAMAVAAALQIKVSITDPIDAWETARKGLPPEFKASMLQSLEKGARTEIDYINGAVVALGAQQGIATPVNQTLVACIKGIEARR
jgi:2-dehydropantoate 2-reductase